MGAVLEPTTDMGNWSVEVRSESAYLYGATLVHREVGFAIRDGEQATVIAAVDQIMAHPGYDRWMNGRSAEGEWSIQPVEGWLRILGPVICYGGKNGPWTDGAVEFQYEHLTTLRDALLAQIERQR